MNVMSHASLPAAAAIPPEFWYSTSFSGTCSFSAAAFASSTVTPRAWPEPGSRVAQKVEAAGPTATATRSAPVGAMSRTVSSSAIAAPVRPTNKAKPAATLLSDIVSPPAAIRDRLLASFRGRPQAGTQMTA